MGTEAQIGKYKIVQGTINNDETWNIPSIAIGDIIIPDGVTLFIKTSVQFYENCGIIVEAGGRLVVDGGILTHYLSDKLWKGILVFGIQNQIQVPQNQGTVELTNGAIIEHAICAISTNHQMPINKGGIIKANNTIFRNNITSIEFGEYIYTSNGKIYDNISRFTLCSFIIDSNNQFSNNGKTFNCHVWMDRVTGITFRGCLFNVNNPYNGRGIQAFESGFKVREFCNDLIAPIGDCECTLPTKMKSIFQNLSEGIYALNTANPGRSVVIDQSKFTNNNIAIELRKLYNLQVTRNEIDLGRHGLEIHNSSGYRIEENYFTGIGINNLLIGILVANSGEDENWIYKNYFNLDASYSYDIYASGNNGYPYNHSIIRGLQIICNEFSSDDNIYIPTTNGTICGTQGWFNESAGNKFFNRNACGFNNYNSSNPIFYFYGTGPYDEPPNTINITKIPVTINNKCASNFCIIHQDSFPPNRLNNYIILQNEYNNLLNEFEDYGFNYVLENLENDEFSEEIILEIYAFLSRIRHVSNLMREISDGAINSILQDSIVDTNLLKSWYETIHTLVAKYSLVEMNLFLKDYEQADVTLFNIPAFFELSEAEQFEHVNYIQFYNLKKQIQQSERDWNELTEDEFAELKSIADSEKGKATAMARSVLCFFYNICYEDDFILPDLEEPVTPKLSEYQNDDIIINVNDIVTFENVIKIEIFNMQGQLVNIFESKNNLDTLDLKPGIYVAKVYTKDLKISSYKFFKP